MDCIVAVRHPSDMVRSTDDSCDWMKGVSEVWATTPSGCEAYVSYDTPHGFHLDSCDSFAIKAHRITYCPGCGRKLVLEG